jgi:hypothetical protein
MRGCAGVGSDEGRSARDANASSRRVQQQPGCLVGLVRQRSKCRPWRWILCRMILSKINCSARHASHQNTKQRYVRDWALGMGIPAGLTHNIPTGEMDFRCHSCLLSTLRRIISYCTAEMSAECAPWARETTTLRLMMYREGCEVAVYHAPCRVLG